MVSVFDLFEKNPNVLYELPEGFEIWQQVNDQATRHTQRSEFYDLYETSRPLEEEVFVEWRNSNKRHITVGQVDRYISSIYRVLKYSSVSLDDIRGLDDEFLDVLSDNPFVVNGQRISLDKLRYDCNIQSSLEDPNAVLVEFPYDPEKPFEPLFENFESSQRFQCDTIYVPYYRIKYAPNDEAEIFIWHSHDEVLEAYDEDREEAWSITAPVYLCVDTEAYYWAYPRLDASNQIEHYLELHYTHDLDRLPIANLPRRIKSVNIASKNNTNTQLERSLIKYGETFIFGALPYFDEAVVRLSQDQVNFARHINPRFWMRGSADCPECNGAKKVHYRKTGFGSGFEEMPCQTCKGTGDMPADMGAFSTYRIADSSHPSDKQVAGVPMGYVTPPTAILDMSNKSWREWLQDGADSLMIDPVDGTSNESGEAKKMRLLAKEDMIKEYGDLEIDTITDILNNKYDLLFPNEETEIVIPKPLTYNVKNADTLKEEYENAPQPLKHAKFLNWKKAEFRGNENKVKAFELASIYSPLMHYDDNELNAAVGTTYQPIDVVRRDYSLIIFEELLQDIDMEEARSIEISEWRERADQWLIDAGIIAIGEAVPENVNDFQDEPIDDAEDFDDEPIDGEAEEEIDAQSEPSGVSQNQEQRIRDVMTGLLSGVLSREEAVNQISQISGRSEEEIEQLLTAQGL